MQEKKKHVLAGPSTLQVFELIERETLSSRKTQLLIFFPEPDWIDEVRCVDIKNQKKERKRPSGVGSIVEIFRSISRTRDHLITIVLTHSLEVE